VAEVPAPPPEPSLRPVAVGVAQKTDGPAASARSEVIPRLREALARRIGPPTVRSAAKGTVVASPLAARIGDDVRVVARPGVGTPMQIRGPELEPSRRSVVMLSNDASDLETARRFLRVNRRLLRLEDPDRELTLARAARDMLGRTHFVFEQRWRGIPVWPAEVNVHLDREGNVDLLDGAFAPTPRKVADHPTIDAEHAVAIARDGWVDAFVSVPELVVYAPVDRFPRLAWRMSVSRAIDDREIVLVDALDGTRLASWNRIESAAEPGSGQDLDGTTRTLSVWKDGSTYYLIDTSKPMWSSSYGSPLTYRTRGSIVIDDAQNQPPTSNITTIPTLYYVTSGSSSSWLPSDAVSAAWWFSETYDYYAEHHGRNSFDDAGRSIRGVVRLGQGYYNAFWDEDSSTMYFGDAEPFAGSLDVIAHEYTHAVTTATANLIYRDQSGALNEAISDIFGEMAEWASLGSNDWLMGTNLSSPIRSMMSPGTYGDPEKMSQYLYTTQDNGGVHTNSGIINKAFYLLASGLDGAIGRSSAEKIFYRALAYHLVQGSQFIDARLACIQSATELFGADSTEAAKTVEAFDGVEIFDASATQPPPSYPTISSEDSTLFIFKDGSSFYLGRRESALGDPPQGSALTRTEVSSGDRAAVSGDGSFTFFMTAGQDACAIETNPTIQEQCLGYPGQIYSVAMSPDTNRFAMVLYDPQGQRPDNRILLIDIQTSDEWTIELTEPVVDGGTTSTVDHADALDFSADGQFLVYDALTTTKLGDGSESTSWSIFLYDLDRDQVYGLVPAVPGLIIAYPAFAQTTDNYLTFDVADTTAGVSTIYVGNLFTGDLGAVAQSSYTFGVPGFTGDDNAIVFSDSTQTVTGASLFEQNLSANRLAPSGSRIAWLSDADYGVIYRRGAYVGPTTSPGAIQFSSSTYGGAEGAATTITVTRESGSAGAVSVNYSTAGGTATSGTDFTPANGTLSWADGDASSKTFTVTALEDALTESTETVAVRLTSPAGGASLGAPNQAVMNIADKSPAPQPPAPPSGLSATVTGENTATLAWTDNANDETGFMVYRSVDGVSFESFGSVGANVTTLGVTGLTPGVWTWFRVTATNANGESGPSNAVAVNTGETPRRRPVRRP